MFVIYNYYVTFIYEGTSQTVLMNKRTSKITRTVNNIIANKCNCCPCISINKKIHINAKLKKFLICKCSKEKKIYI